MMRNSIKENTIIFLSTCFKLGFISKAPGTVGSLAALPFLPVILLYNNIISIALLLIIFFLGMWAAEKYVIKKDDDPSEVVVDEFVGMLSVFYVVQFFTKITLLVIIISFINFRVFDILKPWPISFIDEKIKGGFGIMLDDVAAGIAAGLFSGAITKLIL